MYRNKDISLKDKQDIKLFIECKATLEITKKVEQRRIQKEIENIGKIRTWKRMELKISQIWEKVKGQKAIKGDLFTNKKIFEKTKTKKQNKTKTGIVNGKQGEKDAKYKEY